MINTASLRDGYSKRKKPALSPDMNPIEMSGVCQRQDLKKDAIGKEGQKLKMMAQEELE